MLPPGGAFPGRACGKGSGRAVFEVGDPGQGRVEALAFGASWDTEYPRDAWRLRNLGIDQPEATISFADIPQPWLRELAKRYARWQLATGLSALLPGMKVMFCAFGAGFTWASMVVQW